MDEDFVLALRLQEEFDRHTEKESENGKTDSSSTVGALAANLNSSMSLVDERWETLDPNPEIRALFLQFNDRFFWGKLAGVEVRWSPRMTLCAGLCSYEGHGGLCSVRLSAPLLQLRPRKDLVETLLHEMIHAFLFVTANNRDHDAHGPEFHKHMYRINKETGTNISVYHNFHDEVDHHRGHWWRCDGPCQKRHPYFGIVKRSMNRAPHPRDTWWAQHQASCGGTFTKIKEPENYGKKKEKVPPKSTSPVKPKGVADIRSMFDRTEKGDNGPSSSVSKAPTDSPDVIDLDASPFPGAGVPVGKRKGAPDIRSMFDKTKKGEKGPSSSVSKAPTDSPDVIDLDGPVFPGAGVTIGASSGKPAGKPGLQKSPSPLSDITPVAPNKKVFPGSGFKMGTTPDSVPEPQRVVRRIPGIGLITSERPPPLLPQGKTSTPLVGDPGGNATRKRVRPDDSDSDTEDILNQLRNSKRRKSEPVKGSKRNSIGVGGLSRSFTLEHSLSDVSPGKSRRIPGFKSVSSKGAKPPEFVRKDPRAIQEEREWLIKKGRGTPKGGLHILKPTNQTPIKPPSWNDKTSNNTSIRNIDFSSESEIDNDSEPENDVPKPSQPLKKHPPRDLALNRNQRAILGSDSSDSDSELESSVLTSVYKSKQPKTEPMSRSGTHPDLIKRSSGHTSNAMALPSVSGENSQVAPSSGNIGNDNAASVLGAQGPSVNPSEQLQTCPVCQTRVPAAVMNPHLDDCLGLV